MRPSSGSHGRRHTDAAQQLETAIAELDRRHDQVVVDVPPVAANQAVAALTTADARALVTPATRRGADLLPRQQGRLRDLDAQADHIVATFDGAEQAVDIEDADVTVPVLDRNAIEPTAADPSATGAEALATVTETLFDVALDLEFPDDGWL